MKALTVWQPWADLICAGAKPWEFRGWKVPAAIVGQRIAIHAAARPLKDGEVSALIRELERGSDCGGLIAEKALPVLEWAHAWPQTCPLSHIVCTAIIGAAISPREIAPHLGLVMNDSDRDEHFNFAWPLTEIEALQPPIPARGRQGFWNWEGPAL